MMKQNAHCKISKTKYRNITKHSKTRYRSKSVTRIVKGRENFCINLLARTHRHELGLVTLAPTLDSVRVSSTVVGIIDNVV